MVGRVLVHWPSRSWPQYDNPPICPPRLRVDRQRRTGPETVRDAFTASYKSCLDLSPEGNLRAVQLLLGHTKIESTVRYLGIEVHDALAIMNKLMSEIPRAA